MDYRPIWLSMRTASLSIVLTFFLGTLAARWVAGMQSKYGKGLADVLFTLPLVLPPTVAGFFLLYIFGVKRPVGKLLLDCFGLKLVFTWWGTVLAAVVISFPLMYRAARGAFEQVGTDILDAARTLGLSERQVFWRITVPTALPGLASGAVLAFARGLGEFGATAMIAGNIAGETQTLPLAIYSAVAAGDMETARRYVLVILAISFLVVAAMNLFSVYEHRGKGASR